jgi:hypothetical protein
LTELVGMLSARLHELQIMQNFLALQAQIDRPNSEVATLQRQSAAVS